MNTMLSLLIPALIIVESGSIDNAVSADGTRVGCLQIPAAIVEEVNALPSTQKPPRTPYVAPYALDDRLSRGKACAIVWAYLSHCGNCYRIEHDGEMPTMETLAEMWRRGSRNTATPEEYWKCVQDALASIERENMRGVLSRHGRTVTTSSAYNGMKTYSITR